MIQVGIVGGSGYTAGELIRLLLFHPQAEINFIYSHSKEGQRLDQLHPDLIGQTDLITTQNPSEVDVLFLCLGHGHSGEFLRKYPGLAPKVIDLSNEYRLQKDAGPFVYGLPEYQAERIAQASFIANPGCFATALQLALLPLAQQKLLTESVHINATTGSTGAGRTPSATTHFSWRDNNFSTYKAFTHQHLGEVKETLGALQANAMEPVFFLPQRGNFSRGIYATAYTRFELSLAEARALYSDYYSKAAFTRVSDQPLALKSVVNTNNCLLHLQKHEGVLLITSIIDNLLKGASGQAVQNMNLMFNLPEVTGLQLKASAF
jgi:N-acetyl-gamma-glutamyl-phosphate reductase